MAVRVLEPPKATKHGAVHYDGAYHNWKEAVQLGLDFVQAASEARQIHEKACDDALEVSQ